VDPSLAFDFLPSFWLKMNEQVVQYAEREPPTNSPTLSANPDHAHFNSLTIHNSSHYRPPGQNSLLTHPESTATTNGSAVQPTPPDFMHTVDSVTDQLGKLNFSSAAVPPTLLYIPTTSPRFLPSDNGLLPSSIACRRPLPTSNSTDPRPAQNGIRDRSVIPDNGRFVCMWTDGIGEVCGYKSSPGLVKRHIRRVHLGMRYGTTAINLCV
jgi:hypothetical protein